MNELKKADEIVRALRTECSDCSERNCCNHGNNPVKYCPVIDAADLIDSLTEQLASVTAERDAAREQLCYTCRNGNPSATTKHSTSCDICPWRGKQKGEADD